MATIKLNTDLEQSRKLAEILPLGSADMFCADVFNKEKETHSYNFHILSTWGCNTFEDLKDRENKFVRFIPVWSLASLLGVLPKLHKLQHSENGYYCSLANYKYVTEAYNNPIDACYEMVIKLHELNLL